jgi:hypothetical protein
MRIPEGGAIWQAPAGTRKMRRLLWTRHCFANPPAAALFHLSRPHRNFAFVIIPVLASNGLFPYEAGVLGLSKTGLRRLRLTKATLPKILISLFCLLPVSLILSNCGGGYGSGGSNSHTSGLHTRAFLSDNVSANTQAGIYIVDAKTDVYPLGLAPISGGNTPGMMVVTPNRAQTLVFSGTHTQSSDNTFSVINNVTESNAVHFSLPAYTESFVVSPDSAMAYVAIPNAPVIGQNPGYIQVVNLLQGATTGQINVPSVHYLWMNNGGTRLLAFTDVPATLDGQNCSTIQAFAFVIIPSEVGIKPCPAIPVAGFDHPVQAYFTPDDTTAYIVNCGPECGGAQASVQPFDMTSCDPDMLTCGAPGVAVPVLASTVALVQGSTMYLAGTPYANGAPSQPCTGETTAATTCGLLTIFDLSTMTYQTPIVITDGYHNRIAMGANGQLFIGARTCTEIVPQQPPQPGDEIRGCLSIYNSLSTQVGSVPPGGVLIPPENGDATGIQPIAQRTVVYVVQGGSLLIYDVTIDALEYNPNNPDNPGEIFGLVGNFIDVKTVDF